MGKNRRESRRGSKNLKNKNDGCKCKGRKGEKITRTNQEVLSDIKNKTMNEKEAKGVRVKSGSMLQRIKKREKSRKGKGREDNRWKV